MQNFLGQIAIFGFNFPPRGWSFCAGQLLSIPQFNSVFALVGDFYGGDARTTFGLPDLRGRSPLGATGGTGPGLPNYRMGERGGEPTIVLGISQMPQHTHEATFTPRGGGSGLPAEVQVSTSKASQSTPTAGDYLAAPNFGAGISITEVNGYVTADQAGSTVPLGGVLGGGGAVGGTVTVGSAGLGAPVETQSPFLGVNFCFAMEGVFPSRE